MYRPHDNKRTRMSNENNDKSPSPVKSSTKPTLVRSDSSLRFRHNIFADEVDSTQKAQKTSSEEERIPLKRTESSLTDIDFTETKKRDTRSVETTFRHKEQEMEWKPLGLDIDFDAFNDIMEDGYFSVKDPVFSATEELVEPQHYELVSQSLEPVLKEELISHEEHNTEDDDTSSVEYAPPKEKDIPYIPDDEYIIDLSHFSANVDFTPYEIRSLEDDDKYSLLDDLNELKQMQCRLIDDHSIVFEYEEEEDDSETTTDEDIPAPFSDHVFDSSVFV